MTPLSGICAFHLQVKNIVLLMKASIIIEEIAVAGKRFSYD